MLKKNIVGDVKMDCKVKEIEPGVYEFANKEDFEECYKEHEARINEKLADGSIEIVFLDYVGDALVSAEPTNEGNLTEVLKILPDNIKIHVKKVN